MTLERINHAVPHLIPNIYYQRFYLFGLQNYFDSWLGFKISDGSIYSKAISKTKLHRQLFLGYSNTYMHIGVGVMTKINSTHCILLIMVRYVDFICCQLTVHSLLYHQYFFMQILVVKYLKWSETNVTCTASLVVCFLPDKLTSAGCYLIRGIS